MLIEADLIIKNINQLITCRGGVKVREGLNDIGVLEGIDLACGDGKILYVGKNAFSEIPVKRDAVIINGENKIVMPGFVDAHTHLIYAGDRLADWKRRMSGFSYQEIGRKGSGIMSTVYLTREASEELLIDYAAKWLNIMIENGTTTVEIKSGYGLDFKNEIKILRVAKQLKEEGVLDVAITFLGAHAIPEEYKNDREAYIKLIIEEMLPYVKRENLAEFCDVFCDEGYFSIEESKRILKKAKGYGFKLKIHADELAYTGGAELAAELGAISAEHLIYISQEGINRLAEERTAAVLLPATSFFLKSQKPPVKKMKENGVILALGTDFNPGTAFCPSMLITIGLACYYYDMSIEEAINAATINSAYSIGLIDKLGSIEVGKQADILIFDVPDYSYLAYQFALCKPWKVIKKGKEIKTFRG